MEASHDVPPVFLVLDDDDRVRHFVARALTRLLPGALIAEASCNAEAIGVLTLRKVSGVVEDFQRSGEDAIDLELALIDLGISKPHTILYTGTELPRVQLAFEKKGLTMDDRFAAVVSKLDTEILSERIVAVFSP